MEDAHLFTHFKYTHLDWPKGSKGSTGRVYAGCGNAWYGLTLSDNVDAVTCPLCLERIKLSSRNLDHLISKIEDSIREQRG